MVIRSQCTIIIAQRVLAPKNSAGQRVRAGAEQAVTRRRRPGAGAASSTRPARRAEPSRRREGGGPAGESRSFVPDTGSPRIKCPKGFPSSRRPAIPNMVKNGVGRHEASLREAGFPAMNSQTAACRTGPMHGRQGVPRFFTHKIGRQGMTAIEALW